MQGLAFPVGAGEVKQRRPTGGMAQDEAGETVAASVVGGWGGHVGPQVAVPRPRPDRGDSHVDQAGAGSRPVGESQRRCGEGVNGVHPHSKGEDLRARVDAREGGLREVTGSEDPRHSDAGLGWAGRR